MTVRNIIRPKHDRIIREKGWAGIGSTGPVTTLDRRRVAHKPGCWSGSKEIKLSSKHLTSRVG
jgi:hypothetical protein